MRLGVGGKEDEIKLCIHIVYILVIQFLKRSSHHYTRREAQSVVLYVTHFLVRNLPGRNYSLTSSVRALDCAGCVIWLTVIASINSQHHSLEFAFKLKFYNSNNKEKKGVYVW